MEYQTFGELRKMWQERRNAIFTKHKAGTPIIDLMKEYKISYPRVYQIIKEETEKQYAQVT